MPPKRKSNGGPRRAPRARGNRNAERTGVLTRRFTQLPGLLGTTATACIHLAAKLSAPAATQSETKALLGKSSATTWLHAIFAWLLKTLGDSPLADVAKPVLVWLTGRTDSCISAAYIMLAIAISPYRKNLVLYAAALALALAIKLPLQWAIVAGCGFAIATLSLPNYEKWLLAGLACCSYFVLQ